MAIHPVGDRIVVKLLEQEGKSAGGIILPDIAKEKPQEGKVIAVGKGRLLEDGSVKPSEVHVGDQVLFARYSGTEVTHQADEYLLVKEEDILAVVQHASAPKHKEK